MPLCHSIVCNVKGSFRGFLCVELSLNSSRSSSIIVLGIYSGFRTDFYHIMQSKEDKIGFPPGVAPKLLIQVKRRYLIQKSY